MGSRGHLFRSDGPPQRGGFGEVGDADSLFRCRQNRAVLAYSEACRCFHQARGLLETLPANDAEVSTGRSRGRAPGRPPLRPGQAGCDAVVVSHELRHSGHITIPA